MESTQINELIETKLNQVDGSLWKKICSLNLDLIKKRLEYKHEWTKERIASAIHDYQHYLYFTQLFDAPIAPTKDGDMAWHEHILHTNKYQLDCQFLFGKFLHHLPTPSGPKPADFSSNCSSPCCNKQDCCNDNPTKSKLAVTATLSDHGDCGEPVPDSCVNIGGSDDYCGGTTSDSYMLRVDFDNPDLKQLRQSIPYEMAFLQFLASGISLE